MSTHESCRLAKNASVLRLECRHVACNMRALTLQRLWNASRTGLPRIPVVRHERVTPRSSTFDYGDEPMSNVILNDETLDSVVGGWRIRDIY
jgi:hypothetical protein